MSDELYHLFIALKMEEPEIEFATFWLEPSRLFLYLGLKHTTSHNMNCKYLTLNHSFFCIFNSVMNALGTYFTECTDGLCWGLFL